MYNFIESLLSLNEDVKLKCPDCYDLCFEESPTHCTTCGCDSGGGSISLRTFINDLTDRL